MGFEFLGLAQESNGINMETYQQFHQLFENRTILLNWEVNESLLENVILPLKDFEKDDIDEPVTLILNTPAAPLLTDSFYVILLIIIKSV